MDVYKYNDYRTLLRKWEQSQDARGARSRLASAANASPSWMSRVLNENVQMTPDQAIGIAGLFHLNDNETDYLLLLVELERASSSTLKNRIRRKLNELKEEGRKISASVKTETSVSTKDAARYYSSWVYAAIHVSCMIRPRPIHEIANILLLPELIVGRIVRDLEAMHLLTIEGAKWAATSMNVHLPSDHPNGRTIHASWRNRTIQFFDETRDTGLHYSGVHCLAKADIEKIHDILKDAVINCRQIINDSPSEELGVLCLDWYKL